MVKKSYFTKKIEKNNLLKLLIKALMQSQYTPKSNYTYTGDKAPQRKTITSDSTQNLLCRDVMWKLVADSLGRPAEEVFSQRNGCHLRCCNKSSTECRGAHSLADLKPLPHISKFNNINKANFNWVRLYSNVLKTMQRDLPLVKKEEHKRFVSELTKMNFIDLIQLWRNMACYYNKAAKELLYKRDTKGQQLSVQECGFAYRDDVPTFRIGDDLEDHAWSFERITRNCPINKKFEVDIKAGTQITIWDLCLATGINCKEGIHLISEMLCADDFLTGKCSCLTLEQFEEHEMQLSQQLIDASNKLIEIIEKEKEKEKDTEFDEWVQTKVKKSNGKAQVADPKIKLQKEICKLELQIKTLQSSRMIHYTEQGMTPFDNLYEIFLAEEKIREATKSTEPVVSIEPKKEDWDHGMIGSVAKLSGPVAKVTKFGNKNK